MNASMHTVACLAFACRSLYKKKDKIFGKNLMSTGRKSVATPEGGIDGKALLDISSVEQRKRNAEDPVKAARIFQYGSDDVNHGILLGEILMCDARSALQPQRIMGFTSFNGMEHNNLPAEVILRNLKILGVTFDEWQYGGDNLYGTDPQDHGFGFWWAGKVTIPNSSGTDLFAGDLIAVDVPHYSGAVAKTPDYGRGMIDNGYRPNKYDSNPWEGTPSAKALLRIKRFEPTDFQSQLHAVAWAIETPFKEGGIKGLPADKERWDALTTLQQEALGYLKGIEGIVAAVQLNAAGDIQGILETLFRDHTYNSKGKVDATANAALRFLTEGVGGAIITRITHFKVGRAASSAQKNKDIDLLWRL